jgi:hypothetical protein
LPVTDISPAHPLRDLVEAGALAVRPVLAEAGDAREDDPRVDAPQGVVVDAQAVLHVGAVVLDHHVGVADELEEDLASLRRLQVEGHRPLVAVEVLEIRALARTAHALVRVDARRRFDLDHVGAEVGELLDAGRAGADAGEVEHAQAGERTRGGDVRHGR